MRACASTPSSGRDGDQPLAVVEHPAADRDLAGLLQRLAQQPVRVLAVVARAEVVRLVVEGRVDLLAGDEVLDVDQLRVLARGGRDLLLGQLDEAAVGELVALDDLVVGDLLVLLRAHACGARSARRPSGGPGGSGCSWTRSPSRPSPGTLTSPKVIVPFQIERGPCHRPAHPAFSPGRYAISSTGARSGTRCSWRGSPRWSRPIGSSSSGRPSAARPAASRSPAPCASSRRGRGRARRAARCRRRPRSPARPRDPARRRRSAWRSPRSAWARGRAWTPSRACAASAAALSAARAPRAEHPEPPRVGQVVIRRPARQLEQLEQGLARDGVRAERLVRAAGADELFDH